jgi:hypothetical protein
MPVAIDTTFSGLPAMQKIATIPTRLGVIGGITVLIVRGGCWRLQFFCSIDCYSESQT